MTMKLGYVLGAALALALPFASGCDGGADKTPEPEAKTFVLVHGAWMGAWAWDGVATRLEARGAKVVAVELPAHGEDQAPVAAATLAAYADKVVAAIDEAGEPVVLVGHSMAGIVISRVAEEHPESISELVYLGAYLPASGQSVFELALMDAGSKVGANFVQNEDGTASVKAEAIGEAFCGDCDEASLKLLTANYRDEPLAPLAEPVTLTEGAFGTVKKVYIRTEADAAVTPDLQDIMLAATPVDEELSLATSHSPFLSDPEALADMLAAR